MALSTAEKSRRWRQAHPGRREELNKQSYAGQLSRGTQIQSWASHHLGMERLKEQLGDPRPAGLTLSLVRYDSVYAYWGYAYRKHVRVPYRLSTNPDDYTWELHEENLARRASCPGG